MLNFDNWNLISSFLGIIIGGGITYYVQTKLQKNKEKKLHKAYLLQTQLIICNMLNEVLNLKKKQAEQSYHHLQQPLFLTKNDWKLNKDIIANIILYMTPQEKRLIIACTSTQKKFDALIGAIEDRIKYYERYEIDRCIIYNKTPDIKIQNHMKELIDTIVLRIEDTEDQLKKTFKLIKNYGDKYYEDLSIDYEIIENKNHL